MKTGKYGKEQNIFRVHYKITKKKIGCSINFKAQGWEGLRIFFITLFLAVLITTILLAKTYSEFVNMYIVVNA